MYNVATKILFLVLLISITGCGEGLVVKYVKPSADISYVKKVAVLPFNNLSDDKFAGERVRNAVVVDILSRGGIEVVEPGEVSKVLGLVFREAGFEEGRVVPVDTETIKLIGERLGVQTLILGSVDEYPTGGFVAGGSMVSISIRMLDAGSGMLLWQAKATETGGSVWRKILGIQDVDRSELTRKVVKRALDTLQ